MNIQNFKKTYIKYLMPSGIVPILWGQKGIGKTEAVSQIAETLGFNFVTLNLGSIEDVGDIIGLPEKIHENGQPVATKHLRPTWFPTKPKNIIFIDEFNRMNKSVLQAMHTFLLTQELHTHKLPPESYIICAANPPDDNYTVTDTSDDALAGRLCHINLEPSVDEWITHAMQSDADYRVTSFIQENPEFLEEKRPPFDLSHIKHNRRAWLKFVSPFMSMNPPEEVAFEVVRGVVGTIAATKFMAFAKTVSFRIRGKNILNQYDTVREAVQESFHNKLDVLHNASEELVREIKLTDELNNLQANNVNAYLLDLPVELSYQTIRNILSIGREDLNTKIGNNKDVTSRIKDKLNKISGKKK